MHNDVYDTAAEYDRLRTRLPLISPRRWKFAVVRLVLQTVGRLSHGVRLGWRTGFDSGASLDYVYENRARGVTPLGRLLDRIYLNSIGWRGIRQRRTHLEASLVTAIRRLRDEGRPVRILDIAAGPGRYVLQTLASLGDTEASALLRDIDPHDLEAGRALAAQLGLANVSFEQGDALDAQSLAAIRPRQTLAVVSGFYELFPDNVVVVTSLRGLAQAIEAGGLLIYTNQPRHPQIELIARTLINREGRPWIMRRRTQAEMDYLVRTAGFEKLSQQIDRWGMFTVSVARRTGA